jgi:hypothetical protein
VVLFSSADIPMKAVELYVEDGIEVTTHSMLKTWATCHNQTRYKYVERLKKRYATERDKPLRRGTWFHALLETHYQGGDWKKTHEELSARFGELFDEERDALGDLPRECATLMRSYLWHYGADKTDRFHGWKIHATELTLECPWPDGRGIYRGRVDLLVEDQYGWWIVDHKTHKTLPDMTFRLLDWQSALYIWAARECGYNVQGFIWNYIRTKTPTTPSLAYAGKSNERISTAVIDTDYPTYYLGIKAMGRLGDPVARAKLQQLRSQRWAHGEPQTSPFFRRETLEKDDAMLARVVGSAMRSRDAMRGYDWTATDTIERSNGRHCTWCDYNALCTTELFGGNARALRKQQYKIGDPMEYYGDIKENDSPSG